MHGPHLVLMLHALSGEIGCLAFLWVFIELLNLSKENLQRCKIASLCGFIFFVISWFVGGYYYLTIYGSVIKPHILSGTSPWAHFVFMETKEHVFLFLPFLSLVFYLLLKYSTFNEISSLRKTCMVFSFTIFFIGALMVFMGLMISMGFRTL